MNNNVIEMIQGSGIIGASWATHILAVKAFDNTPLQTISLVLACIVSLLGIYNFIAVRLERRRDRKTMEP